MTLTPEQSQLVTTSFRKVVVRGTTTTDLFFKHLFELDPTLKTLFPPDMGEMYHKFMQTLGVLVSSLHEGERGDAPIRALARRHVRYGVKPQYYATVGEALLWALERVLGDDFTPETREAWKAVYDDIAAISAGEVRARLNEGG